MSKSARQKHIAFLKAQLNLEKAKLESHLAAVEQLKTDVEQLKTEIAQIQKNISYFNQVISEVAIGHEELLCKVCDVAPKKPFIKNRNPKQALRAEYKAMTLAQVIKKVLQNSQRPVSAREIAQKIFESNDRLEYHRARNSLSTELRRGAKLGKWQQIDRGLFCAAGLEVK